MIGLTPAQAKKLSGEDLRQIAKFHRIVKNYLKMQRLLNELKS